MSARISVLVLSLALVAHASAQQTWDLASRTALDASRCLACHGADAAPSPRLRLQPRAWPQQWLAGFLAGHQRLTSEQADALALFLAAQGAVPPPTEHLATGEVEVGERLWRESGCVACHRPDGIDGLAQKTWLPMVYSSLRSPPRAMAHSHAFGFSPEDAHALAAYLLRSQMRNPPAKAEPGLRVECFELPITNAGIPELDGKQPSRVATARKIDVEPRSRDDDFALRFTGFLNVPAEGDWHFWTGSDDSSWLWIDDQLVVRNEGLAPHRRRDGRAHLTAGPHRIRVLYTEARGGQSLEVLWQGPGVEREELPARVLASAFVEFEGPHDTGGAAGADVSAGRALFAERRCNACHDPEDRTVPRAKPWNALRTGADCALATIPASLRPLVGRPLNATPDARTRLELALQRDGCASCHARDGSPGLSAAARALLVEREDLGEEGKLPPDLSGAGRHLRSEWIRAVIDGSRRARPYLAVRMPAYDDATATRYTELFAAADEKAGDVEPVVDDATVAAGRALAGNSTGGYACIACHRVAGQRSLGPQGMDLAMQYQRLRPDWIREWIHAPIKHRPNTRMPTFFPDDSPQTLEKIEHLVAWLSLGDSLPLPDGIVPTAGQWRLAVGDRPRLHGAFLTGLSARCIAVATPERVNWAYDMAHARLAWIWRGEFLDTSGTWDGRAGQLLKPLGSDWIDLPAEEDRFELLDGTAATPRMLGWRLQADGHPVMRIGLGNAVIEDAPHPRYAPGGSILVRRIHVEGGDVRLRLPHGGNLASEPAGVLEIHAGETKEVTYRW
ncbi:MAG: c-type cytochrome [Planctomycetota bacterium]